MIRDKNLKFEYILTNTHLGNVFKKFWLKKIENCHPTFSKHFKF